METDSFFYQLFQQLPQTLFELIELPAARAKAYRFDSVEVKKSIRIDGLFVPTKSALPLYFVEVQFQRVQTFYANLFAKVFCYLEENDPKQDWVAVAIFPTRKEEPRHLGPYEDLLQSKRVKRVYLDEYRVSANPPLGLGILHLLSVPMNQAQDLAPRLLRKARGQSVDSDSASRVIQLVEKLLLNRFPQFDREEMRMKFKLHDIRESKVWKEAHEEGEVRMLRKNIEALVGKGMTFEKISALLDISVDKIRRVAENRPDQGCSH